MPDTELRNWVSGVRIPPGAPLGFSLLAPKSETFRSWLTRPHTIKSRRSASFLHPFRGSVGGRCGRDPGSRVRLGASSLVSGRGPRRLGACRTGRSHRRAGGVRSCDRDDGGCGGIFRSSDKEDGRKNQGTRPAGRLEGFFRSTNSATSLRYLALTLHCPSFELIHRNPRNPSSSRYHFFRVRRTIGVVRVGIRPYASQK
jgi:hypothetical protein